MKTIRKPLFGFAMAIVTVLLGIAAKASDFQYQGKSVTKGEAIRILIANPQAKVLKVDQVIFDNDKGTIKNAPKK